MAIMSKTRLLLTKKGERIFSSQLTYMKHSTTPAQAHGYHAYPDVSCYESIILPPRFWIVPYIVLLAGLSLLVLSFLPDNIVVDFFFFLKLKKSYQLCGPTSTTNLRPEYEMAAYISAGSCSAFQVPHNTAGHLLLRLGSLLLNVVSRLYPILSIVNVKHLNLNFLLFES